MKCGHDDCFTCPYTDCILPEPEQPCKSKKDAKRIRSQGRWKAYYAANQEKICNRSKEYYYANYEVISQKRKEAYRRKKMCQLECHWCHKDLNKPRYVMKYKRKYFCNEDCLGEYLVSQAEPDVEVVWHDTPENMRICAEEAKHE